MGNRLGEWEPGRQERSSRARTRRMHLSGVSAGGAGRERRTGYLCLALLCSGVLCIRGGYEEERVNERRETHVKKRRLQGGTKSSWNFSSCYVSSSSCPAR